jgi:hypothetical protein
MSEGVDIEQNVNQVNTSATNVISYPENNVTERHGQTITKERIAELKLKAAQKKREYDQQDRNDFLNSITSGLNTTESNTPKSLMVERPELGDEIGLRFEAHGIRKGGSSDQLDSLLILLDKGVDKTRPFYTTNLYASDENITMNVTGAAGPYDEGGFIVLGEPRSVGQTAGSNIQESGVRGVLVNREWYDEIPDLQEAYPDVRFIRSDQMKEELTKWLQLLDKK